jgi:hypothetical protein
LRYFCPNNHQFTDAGVKDWYESKMPFCPVCYAEVPEKEKVEGSNNITYGDDILKEYFCKEGHQFNRDEVKDWLADGFMDQARPFCPFCYAEVPENVKNLTRHYMMQARATRLTDACHGPKKNEIAVNITDKLIELEERIIELESRIQTVDKQDLLGEEPK